MNFEGKERQAACDWHDSWDVLSWKGRMQCGTVRNSRVHLVRPGENKAGGWQRRQFQPHTTEAHSSAWASLPSSVKHPC